MTNISLLIADHSDRAFKRQRQRVPSFLSVRTYDGNGRSGTVLIRGGVSEFETATVLISFEAWIVCRDAPRIGIYLTQTESWWINRTIRPHCPPTLGRSRAELMEGGRFYGPKRSNVLLF